MPSWYLLWWITRVKWSEIKNHVTWDILDPVLVKHCYHLCPSSTFMLSVLLLKWNPVLTVRVSLPLLYQPGAKMVTASKATVPTISDQASAMQLSQCAKNLASALGELRTAAQKVLLISIYYVAWRGLDANFINIILRNYTLRAIKHSKT